jgi:hypothetical protein
MTRLPSSDIGRTYVEYGERNLGNWPTKDLLVKRVCGDCNNGWMSRLENDAKPILESILDDKLDVLNVPAQCTLALWAVKTAMVLETIDANQTWFYSENERRLMRVLQVIPQRTSVWIAKCSHQPNVHSEARHLQPASDEAGAHALAVTMAFGPAAFQVVTVRPPAEVPADATVTYDVSDGPWDQTLVQIWPTSHKTQVWPPAYGLEGDLGLMALTERLSPWR